MKINQVRRTRTDECSEAYDVTGISIIPREQFVQLGFESKRARMKLAGSPQQLRDLAVSCLLAAEATEAAQQGREARIQSLIDGQQITVDRYGEHCDRFAAVRSY